MWFQDENEIDFQKYCVAYSHLQWRQAEQWREGRGQRHTSRWQSPNKKSQILALEYKMSNNRLFYLIVHMYKSNSFWELFDGATSWETCDRNNLAVETPGTCLIFVYLSFNNSVFILEQILINYRTQLSLMITYIMRQDVHGYVIHTIWIINISFTTHVLSQWCQIYCDHDQHFFQNYHYQWSLTTITAVENHLLGLERDAGPLLGGENLAVPLPVQRQRRRGKALLSILKLSIIQFIIGQRRGGRLLLSISKAFKRLYPT